MKKIIILAIALLYCTSAFAGFADRPSARVTPLAGDTLFDVSIHGTVPISPSGNALFKVTIDAGAPIDIFVRPGTSIVGGVQDVAVPETAEALSTPGLSVTRVVVKAKPGNTSLVFIGTEGVQYASGFHLSPDAEIELYVDDVDDVYVAVSLSGDGVSWIGEMR